MIPLGPAFSSAEVLGFLRHLRPTAILGMPSAIMALANYVACLESSEEKIGGGIVKDTSSLVIKKVITGSTYLCLFILVLSLMSLSILNLTHAVHFTYYNN